MRKLLIISISLSLFLSSAYAIHELMPSETILPFPGADAQAVYKYITAEDQYKSWELWPGKGRLYAGKHPHGSYLTTYVNDNAIFSIKAGKPMLNGSLIVKENYTPEKKLDALTLMYKIKGYNPDAGDWFWVKYDIEGKVLAEGKVQKCIECHSSMKENDYVFTGKFLK